MPPKKRAQLSKAASGHKARDERSDSEEQDYSSKRMEGVHAMSRAALLVPPQPSSATPVECARCGAEVEENLVSLLGVRATERACARCFDAFPAFQALGYSWEECCGLCNSDKNFDKHS